MRNLWYFGAKKPWSYPGEDWLCIFREASHEADTIFLDEGSHHYFTEVHLFRTGNEGQEIHDAFRTERVGPFEIPLEGNGTWEVYAKVRFFARSNEPELTGSKALIECGRVKSGGNVSPLAYQLTGERTADLAVGGSAPPSIAEVRRTFLNVGSEMPPRLSRGSLQGGGGQVSFHLDTIYLENVEIFLFGPTESGCPLPPPPGTRMEFSNIVSHPAFLKALGRCHIATGLRQVPIADNLPPFNVAIPVAHSETTGSGLVGYPLAVSPLIGGAEIKKRPPVGVFASWKWSAPTNWITVILKWRFYNDNPVDEKFGVEEMRVTWAEYRHRNIVEFISYSRGDLRGWGVELWIEPLLLGEACGLDPLYCRTAL
jgi:hypothetical protein